MSDNISLSGDVSRNFVCTWQTVMISFWTLIIIRRLTCLCGRVKLTGREAVFSVFLDSKETNDYGLLNWKGKKVSLLLILMFYWTLIIVIYWQKQKQIFVHDGQQCMHGFSKLLFGHPAVWILLSKLLEIPSGEIYCRISCKTGID